jgi:hypothetical protein
MLREPFQWLFSAIYHDLGRGRIPTRDGVFWLRDALDHTLHIKKWGNTGYSYINYQTRWLAGGNVGTRLQLAAFERAKQLIDRMDVVGDPIYMRETVCLSLYTIRSSSFQKCNCSFLPPSGNVRVQQQHSAKMIIDYPVISELAHNMQTDILLYAYAHARLFNDVRRVQEETGQIFQCPSG